MAGRVGTLFSRVGSGSPQTILFTSAAKNISHATYQILSLATICSFCCQSCLIWMQILSASGSSDPTNDVNKIFCWNLAVIKPLQALQQIYRPRITFAQQWKPSLIWAISCGDCGLSIESFVSLKPSQLARCYFEYLNNFCFRHTPCAKYL